VISLPNAVGAKDLSMVSVFEPDEVVQYRPTIRMLTAGDNLRRNVREFFAYKHYFYGYPFFLFSAIFGLLPLKLTVGLGGIQWNYLMLRQIISVLPMLAALLMLVYLQTKNKNYFHSIPLLVFLLFIPAVVKNNTWWHPDSLVIMFITLTFFFFVRDDFNFNINFYLAAIACGLSIGTKLIGLFFFLAVPIYILWGIKIKRIDLSRAFKLALSFVAIMVVTFIISNPFLLIPSERAFALRVQKRQAEAMAFGWHVAYEKGPLAWLPVIKEYYGSILFVLFSIFTLGMGVYRRSNRLFNVLIVFWAVPFALYVLFTIVIRPSHFLLPIALPVYSSLIYAFPLGFWKDIDRFSYAWVKRNIPNLILWVTGILIVGSQFYGNVTWSLEYYIHMLHREDNSPAIGFYEGLEGELSAIENREKPLVVLRDMRVYIPDQNKFVLNTQTGPFDYDYLGRVDPEMIVLWKQRILDYTNDGVLENAKDYTHMKEIVRFYTDAGMRTIDGYEFFFEDDFGIVFIKRDLYR
jgi:hypothetical protein